MQKSILITGSSRGIGAAVARLAKKEGYEVLLHGRTKSADLIKISKELDAKYFVFDVCDETEVKNQIEKTKKAGSASLDNGQDDALLEQAISIIRETHRASTSSLQRRLRIGYTRAARLMDILEERGVVGPPRGSDPREILLDLDGGIPENPADIQENEEVSEE